MVSIEAASFLYVYIYIYTCMFYLCGIINMIIRFYAGQYSYSYILVTDNILFSPTSIAMYIVV